MKEILSKFKDYLIREGHSSNAYIFPVKKFLEIYSVGNINQDNIDKYMTEITQKYKPSYVNSIHSALRSFFRFLEKDFKIPKDLIVPLKKVKSLSMDFVEKRILPAVNSINFICPYKVKAIIYLMVYTGMRKSEIPLLKRADIDMQKRRLKVYLKKTKKEHIFLFPKKVAKVMENYFSTEPERTNAFNAGLSVVNNIFKKLKLHFKDEEHLFPHLFKKTAVTHLHNVCKFTLKEVSEMVGISVKTIEEHYLDLDIDKIYEDYDRRIK